jgi:hypothetical protein
VSRDTPDNLRRSGAQGPPEPGSDASGDFNRQGFIGYFNAEGSQWRVMIRLWLDDGTWWRGRLWFTERGGTEVWDKEEIVSASAEEVLSQARALPHEEILRRFKHSFDERRRYFAMRALLDELLDKGRQLNRIAVRVASGEMDRLKAAHEIDRIQQEMRTIVEGLRDVAGKEGRGRGP